MGASAPLFSAHRIASMDGASPLLLSHDSIDMSRRQRQASRGQFSRLPRRSTRRNTAADFRGDFIIHDFINAKKRSLLLEAEHKREAGGRW